MKRRPRELTLPVLVADVEAAATVGRFDERASRLAGAFWPGGLTLVLPRTEPEQRMAAGQRGADRGRADPRPPGGDGPAPPDRPAGRHQRQPLRDPPAADCEEALRALGDAVAVYLCAGRLPGTASTVALVAEGRVDILRVGAVPGHEVLAAIEA